MVAYNAAGGCLNLIVPNRAVMELISDLEKGAPSHEICLQEKQCKIGTELTIEFLGERQAQAFASAIMETESAASVSPVTMADTGESAPATPPSRARQVTQTPPRAKRLRAALVEQQNSEMACAK